MSILNNKLSLVLLFGKKERRKETVSIRLTESKQKHKMHIISMLRGDNDLRFGLLTSQIVEVFPDI